MEAVLSVTQISFDELYDAYVVYRHILGLARNKNSRRKFFQFLGFTDDDKIFLQQQWLGEEPVRKIRWLTGPHALAMYRVWEIQHERSHG